MFIRLLSILMAPADETAGGGGVPAAAPAAVVTPPAPAAPVVGEEFKAMTAEQFKARLDKEREAGIKALLKDFGAKDSDEVKTLLKAQRDKADAEKTELQKLQEKAAALEPSAKRATELEKAITGYLAAEEKSIPAEKQSLLDLAPPAEQPEARLAWISKAKAAGLFTVASPAAATTEEKKLPPANTRAGTTPPAPAPPTGQKHPREMNDAEFKEYEARWKAQNAIPRF